MKKTFYCLPSNLIHFIRLLHTSLHYMEDLHLYINIYENKNISILMFQVKCSFFK